MMGWVVNEGDDINWNVSPVSSPDTLLSHRGEFNRAMIIGPLLFFLLISSTTDNPRNLPGIFALVWEGFDNHGPSLLNVQSRKQKHFFSV